MRGFLGVSAAGWGDLLSRGVLVSDMEVSELSGGAGAMGCPKAGANEQMKWGQA
ncbi:MAG: hypothetical protein Kow0031_06730 [Anaerolineae bacterium]